MATNNDTWSADDGVRMADSKAKLGSGTFMKELFFGYLELEGSEAKRLAKKNARFEASIRKKAAKLKAAYLDLRKVLLEATKESYKY